MKLVVSMSGCIKLDSRDADIISKRHRKQYKSRSFYSDFSCN